MRTLLLRHFPELEPALRGVANAFAPWQRGSGHVTELAPGIHRLGHGAGGRVSAFLLETAVSCRSSTRCSRATPGLCWTRLAGWGGA